MFDEGLTTPKGYVLPIQRWSPLGDRVPARWRSERWVQPPNDKALWITIAFLVVTALVWFGTEKRRFKGPPQGVMIQGLQEQIKAAERAVGETTG